VILTVVFVRVLKITLYTKVMIGLTVSHILYSLSVYSLFQLI